MLKYVECTLAAFGRKNPLLIQALLYFEPTNMQAQSHALYLLDNVASASSRSPGDWVVKLRKQLQAWPKYKTSQGIQLAASKTYQTYI